MGLVHHDQVFVLKQDVFLKGDGRFLVEGAEVVNGLQRGVSGLRIQCLALVIQNVAVLHALQPLCMPNMRKAFG